ncbi:MAG: NAD(P)H-hydrate dehydratase [Anaerovoracaceae bacterium]
MNAEVNGYLKEDLIRTLIGKRDPDIHKGDCGRDLVIAGGAGMTGAAVFASEAAMRSGAGLVYVATPAANYPVLQIRVPEAICIDWNTAVEQLSGNGDDKRPYDAVCFGPGMGTGAAAKRRLKALLLSYGGKLVIDADGLNLLAQDPEPTEFARNFTGELVITPHVGEAKRLLGSEFYGNTNGRNGLAVRLAEKYNAVAILKGARSLVARLRGPEDGEVIPEASAAGSEAEIWENTTGNPGMATAGSGDVLTGVITALMGQGLSAWDAARAGCWLHGRAGDIAAEEKGEYGLIARDIAEAMPYAIKNVINS